jgi:phosphoribosyl-ATP pyrophosphohydrolase
MTDATLSEMFERLYATVVERRSADPETSYVARLTGKGRVKIAQKLG